VLRIRADPRLPQGVECGPVRDVGEHDLQGQDVCFRGAGFTEVGVQNAKGLLHLSREVGSSIGRVGDRPDEAAGSDGAASALSAAGPTLNVHQAVPLEAGKNSRTSAPLESRIPVGTQPRWR